MMKDILLVCMPFYELHRPSLALGTLKAVLNNNGISCDVIYPNIEFASKCGADLYGYISREFSYSMMLGEWLFKELLYGEDVYDKDNYIEKIERNWTYRQLSARDAIALLKVMAKEFIDTLAGSNEFEEYSIIGFTSSFHQNIASLALAKKLKTIYPDKIIIFGGANCEGVMGYALHKNFPFLDYVFTGESEISILKLVGMLKSGEKPTLDNAVDGVVFRENGKSILIGEPEIVQVLDEVPVPDHSDFFSTIRNTKGLTDVAIMTLFETSRGCWWGAKAQCLFCGLNGKKLHYRSKSPERAYREIRELYEKYRCDAFHAADNVIDRSYYESLLPMLSYNENGLRFFYEIRSDIKKQQIVQLAKSGVFYVQPGIESLSDNLLKIMHKGVSVTTNIQCLKWLREYGIHPEWNIITGFPGEMQGDYDEMLSVIPYILHLKPPANVGEMRLDRFSPYFNNPEKYGIRSVRPDSHYKHIYNMDDEQLMDIAYSFEFDMDSTDDHSAVLKSLREAVDIWRKNEENSRLEYWLSSRELNITDTRYGEKTEYVLPIVEATAYLYCDEARTLGEITGYICEKIKKQVDEANVKSFLDNLVSDKLMINIGNRYLSLAVRVK